MSFLDGSSFSASFSFIGLDFGALDNDPYRSRNTVASAQNAYKRGVYSESTEIKDLGSGAVFQVTLRQANATGELYAVKTALAAEPNATSKTSSANTGVFAVLREIQVVSNVVAETHPNILNVIGWDWSRSRIPVVFVEYAELGTLKDWLPTNGPSLQSYEKRKICLDVACGLNALHSIDIAHGDVKLANTLVFPNTKGGVTVKLSDFSHAIFGLSTKRKSAYPGSRLYNAPEIRNPESIVLSDRLPRSETFSFGLLVWEVLKNGTHFFERGWIGSSSTGTSSAETLGSGLDSLSNDTILSMAQDSIESWGYDGLMARAQSFSGVCDLARQESTTFYHVFTITLRDRADLRRDMQTVAMALDTFDEGRILHYSHRLAVSSFAVWEFDPLSPVSWKEQVAFVEELQFELAQPVQPNHAELAFILSRCFAEGYGVNKDLHEAIRHLHVAASLDNVEASCLIEIGATFLEKFRVEKLPKLAQNQVSKSVRSIHAKVSKIVEADKTVSPAAYMKGWNVANCEFVKARQFFWHKGTRDLAFEWTSQSIRKLMADVTDSGEHICDITITFPSLVTSYNSGKFFEVCASFGIPDLFDALKRTKNDDYSESSWGDHHEVWSRLLNAAAKAGELLFLQKLLSYKLVGDTKEWSSPTGESPLHYLSFLEQSPSEASKLVQHLLKIGIDINGVATARTWIPPFSIELSGTPLHMAIRARCRKTVKVLIDHGADPFEAFGDIGTPLQMAASLHLHGMIEVMFNAIKFKPHHLDGAVKAIGVPSKKGWYERCLSKSPKTPHDALREDMYRTASTLLLSTNVTDPGKNSEQPVKENEDIDAHTFKDYWRVTQTSRNMLDGWPLIECIAQGQRDLWIPSTIIELGLYPNTDAARFQLLAAILGIWTEDQENPLPSQLLKLVLDSHADRPHSCYWAEWISGWPRFFESYRHISPEMIELPVLHHWILQGRAKAVRILTEVFQRTRINQLVSMRDTKRRSALQIAIDEGSREIYDCLKPYKDTTIQDDICMARSSYPPSKLLPALLNMEMEEIETGHFQTISKLAAIIREESLKDSAADAIESIDCCSLWALSDALVTYAEWAIETHQLHQLHTRINVRPKEQRRQDISEACLLTAVNLRMQAIGTRSVEDLDALRYSGCTVPAGLIGFYQFEGPTETPNAQLQLERIQARLALFHEQNITWIFLGQKFRIGQPAVLEWFREQHFINPSNMVVDFDERFS
ncbi:hypothetical protein DM02DRAFT_656852 [Periconia macrospinosa]|uniref:Protein kinase domain-containing protein n=1 Tax=Periconia macrospinosa TaxID=97972 RepID=A0A2V1DNY6_9PLEO|nr:hypothetical protein DM02DRAFT_656852 [Periconia macrospinosa]